MRNLKQFLDRLRLSSEFKEMALGAAREAGYDPSENEDWQEKALNERVTLILGQVLFELTDERFTGRKHHRRKLYNSGCRGPLCRKAERDRSRNRYRSAHSMNPKQYNKRASMFDDKVLNFVAKRYDSHLASQEGNKAA